MARSAATVLQKANSSIPADAKPCVVLACELKMILCVSIITIE